ncbi:hypothetical protein K7I13_14385 [Brucepastera parasyntrophica]|uniref:hypothetical protein n=1 Tax=Brucepastera parasyntrophica TaxID=2880008 RepID=UPI00210D159A|nr:hypothetical protein [Brucepastera parasyntrophica]ULQ59628.1 hypothetical protein K7I13_14385 [Brucepastera parasyntrophica]
MKKWLFFSVLVFFAGTASALKPEDYGLRAAFDLSAGLGGAEIESHKAGLGGSFSFFAIIGITDFFALEAEFAASFHSLRFATAGRQYSDGKVTVSFFALRIPVLARIRFPAGPGVISVSGGLALSMLPSKQIYTDESLERYSSRFLDPFFNCEIILGADYTYPLGIGKLIAGLRFSLNLFERNYRFNNYDVHIGRTLTFSPLIGYSISLPFSRAEKNDSFSGTHSDQKTLPEENPGTDN